MKRKEMKLMELAAMVNDMEIGEVIDFACGTEDEAEWCGRWCGIKRISEFSNDNPMYIVSHYGGEAEANLYHISEYDHRIGDFCEKELGYRYRLFESITEEEANQKWINCCAKMIADYIETWGDGSVPDVITVEWEEK